MLGIGIVGCGMISEVHAEAIRALAGARVVAFCDRKLAAAEARAAQFGGAAFTRIEDLVAHPRVDAISICTPSGSHLEPALVAANAGKHVIVEKPIEVTVARADAIIGACRENRVKLGAIFPRRLLGSSMALKRAIDAGRFGVISLADVYVKWFRDDAYYATSHWRGTRRYDGGGALMNQGIHGVDLVQWLLGGVDEASAFVATRGHVGLEVEDVAVAALRFRNGALGVVEATTCAWPGDRLRIEIAGTHGSAVLEDETIRAWRFRDPSADDDAIVARFGARGATTGGATDPRAIDGEGHRRQFADFVAAIHEDRPPKIDGAEARAAVAIVDAIYRSATEARPVRVEGIPPWPLAVA